MRSCIFALSCSSAGSDLYMRQVLLSTSIVANLQLLAGAFVWGYVTQISETGLTADNTSVIVSLSGGALVANIVSVVMLVSETLMSRR